MFSRSHNMFKAYAFSRRQWLQGASLHLLGLGLFDQLAIEATGQTQAQAAVLPPLNRFPRLVQEFFVEQVRAAEQTGLRARDAMQTRADAEAYVRTVREKINRCFGP